ncbi:uncharacterized protein LOC115739977 [Rhodamnia argentea]|uniref:Protein TIFY n=1 Tax=Rhodamnia argentea TaxID=178133 RepID=A0A8B8P2U1_9MYRT|nr:uncharacterized protein LOC115739977 [Rhodamnia argentea]
MERDFLGLGSREPLSVVKEEIGGEACGDSGPDKGTSGMRWPFLNKVSAVPHLMSFKAAQDEKTKKISEPIVSSGSTHIPVADAYDSSRRRTVVEVQSSFNRHRQGGSQFSLTSYPQQSHPRDARLLPLSNQGIPASIGDSFFKTHYTATGQPLPGNMKRQKLPGGVLVSAPNSDHLAAGLTMGTTESWKPIKPTMPPSQLTIFYAGTVNVYDCISPEKAEAIMFLARNGAPMEMASKTSQTKCFVQGPTTANTAGDHVDLNQPAAQPFSSLSSPLSVSSHPASRSRGGPTGKDESKDSNAKGVGPPSKLDIPKMVSVMGSASATTMVPSAIPQARKASLARFLEKRKERVVSAAAPYNLSKNSPERATPHSSAVNCSPALAMDKGSHFVGCEMEREFLGLSLSEPSGVVKKEEISSEVCRDSGLNKDSGTRWPLLDKFCTVPDLKPELPGGGVVATPNSGLLGAASTLGTTEPRNISCRNAIKSYGPNQLTIFYAGTVVVYDDVPPEKVQALMFLARSGTCKSPKTLHSRCHVQAPTPGNIISNHVVLKQPATRPCSGLSSPFSVVSHPAPELGSGPTNMEKGNTEGVTAPGKVDSPKMVGAMRSTYATTMISAALPQPPKASLARFLEKRKERVRNAAPYSLSKNSSPECATPASNPAKLSSGPAMDKDCTQ